MIIMYGLGHIQRKKKPKPRFPVIKIFKDRFSPRVFSAKPIPNKHLRIIFEAARLTPSGRNNQPWFFYWMKKSSSAYKKVKLCIPERNFWALSAPVIIIACYDPSEPVDKVNKWATYDLGASVISLVLQAQDLGYYSRQIGIFDTEKIRKFYHISPSLIPFILIAMGEMGTKDDYAAAEKSILEREVLPWSRREIIDKELL